VERALGTFIPSNDDGNPANFNRKSWNRQVRRYCEVIESKFQPGSMEDIVLKACAFMKPATDSATFIAPSRSGDADSEEIETLDMFVDA
jgi:hypothetical protein